MILVDNIFFSYFNYFKERQGINIGDSPQNYTVYIMSMGFCSWIVFLFFIVSKGINYNFMYTTYFKYYLELGLLLLYLTLYLSLRIRYCRSSNYNIVIRKFNELNHSVLYNLKLVSFVFLILPITLIAIAVIFLNKLPFGT